MFFNTIIDAPPIVQIFFCLIFLFSWLGFFIVFDHKYGSFDKPEIRSIAVNAPLLCGFGGTVSNLFAISSLDVGMFVIEEAFLGALATSIYGVTVSVIVEVFIGVRILRTKTP